jgi:hypothetical protein
VETFRFKPPVFRASLALSSPVEKVGLASGTLVHFHDMFWPFEYPRGWVIEEKRSWNELYAVRAFLSDNDTWMVAFFNDYFGKLEGPLVETTYPDFLKNPGGALWLRRV